MTLSPAPTVSSKTAPLPVVLVIVLNSVLSVVEETVREDIRGTFVTEATAMSGEEESFIPVKETPLRVREAVEMIEMKDDVSGVVDD